MKLASLALSASLALALVSPASAGFEDDVNSGGNILFFAAACSPSERETATAMLAFETLASRHGRRFRAAASDRGAAIVREITDMEGDKVTNAAMYCLILRELVGSAK